MVSFYVETRSVLTESDSAADIEFIVGFLTEFRSCVNASTVGTSHSRIGSDSNNSNNHQQKVRRWCGACVCEVTRQGLCEKLLKLRFTYIRKRIFLQRSLIAKLQHIHFHSILFIPTAISSQ